MGNIITPKTVVKRGQEVWHSKKDEKKNTQPTKVERTGDKSFVVTHEDGSKFEGTIDPKRMQFKEDGMKSAGGSSRFFVSDEIRPRNVMSNEDRRRLGIEEDETQT